MIHQKPISDCSQAKLRPVVVRKAVEYTFDRHRFGLSQDFLCRMFRTETIERVVNSLADPQLGIYLPITDILVCSFQSLERSNSFFVCVETLLGSSKQ